METPPDLDAIPEEFRPACGHPGAHALCDLTGVVLSYPGHGGATVLAKASGVSNSMGFLLTVQRGTLDVTVEVRLHRNRSNDPPGTKYH